ncbi:MAG TPA: DedA family protein [Vicinamibacterales bacterium]|nr:DedA family protein [Vicinamibacterales bacterium]
MDPSSLASLLHNWGYPALLVLLCATGVGSPIPEDLLLLSGGYLISAGVFSWPVTLPLAVTGVVASDFVLYTFGRRMRRQAGGGRLGRMVPAGRLARFGTWFDSVGTPAVFIARLVPGTRAVVFITAGLRGVRPATFLLYDIAGALVWVPILVWLGTALGEEIGGLTSLMAGATRLFFWILLGVILLLAIWRLWRAEESKL